MRTGQHVDSFAAPNMHQPAACAAQSRQHEHEHPWLPLCACGSSPGRGRAKHATAGLCTWVLGTICVRNTRSPVAQIRDTFRDDRFQAAIIAVRIRYADEHRVRVRSLNRQAQDRRSHQVMDPHFKVEALPKRAIPNKPCPGWTAPFFLYFEPLAGLMAY